LSGAFGYTRSTFIRYNDPVTGKNLDGEFTPYTPEFNASFAAQYKHPKGWFGRIQFVAVGETFYDEANTGRYRQASYGLLNTRVGWERKHFAVYCFGNNVTDTEYFANKIVDLNAGVPGDPAIIGVMAKLTY
jgi:iron complex outermembrane receptor protein